MGNKRLENQKKWRAANPDKVMAYDRKYKKNNRDKRLAYNKLWASKNKEHRADYQLQKNYGISLKDKLLMEEQQQYRCKICKKRAKLFVDHCHTTGKVRGLLCTRCNTGIGYFMNNIDNLDSAKIYLQEAAL